MKSKRLGLLIFTVFCASIVFAGDVTVSIADGIENASVKSKMERSMSLFLSEVNLAHSQKRDLNFSKLGVASNVQESVSMLWENSPFECADEAIVEHCLNTGNGYQVRNIPLLMRPLDTDSFNEEEYQEAVFSFDPQGNMESFYLTIDLNMYMKVIRANNNDITDHRRRALILDYVEHFRTAYNQKDINFLDQVFSDDALIITGKVIQRKTGDGLPLPSKIEYKKQDKKTYLSRLKSTFAASRHIKVTFDDISVMRHPVNKDIFGVTLHQGYTSDRYSDEGYVFLLWDFTDEKAPKIHVRTWQPDKFDDGRKLPQDEIFSLSDFDI